MRLIVEDAGGVEALVALRGRPILAHHEGAAALRRDPRLVTDHRGAVVLNHLVDVALREEVGALLARAISSK